MNVCNERRDEHRIQIVSGVYENLENDMEKLNQYQGNICVCCIWRRFSLHFSNDHAFFTEWKPVPMERLGVFTSGGDAPGMNAAIRAVVRMAAYHTLETVGIEYGYRGMINGDFIPLQSRSVSNIIQRGGTVLRTARSPEFRTIEGRQRAYQQLEKNRIDALIGIGGNGTFRGLTDLVNEFPLKVIGVPGTIDNDLYGTDYTIGFDTAINTALSTIDRIRDTAAAHERLFYVEVMGRDSGFIALDVGIASGAEYIAIPETHTNIEEIRNMLAEYRKDKSSAIIVVAEGDEEGNAFEIANKIKDTAGYDYRISVIGHVQRGGSPTARDRILASRLGAAAVERLIADESNIMVGETNGKIVSIPLHETWEKRKEIDPRLMELARILSL
jgi:6-phosphofructokinase 1